MAPTSLSVVVTLSEDSVNEIAMSIAASIAKDITVTLSEETVARIAAVVNDAAVRVTLEE